MSDQTSLAAEIEKAHPLVRQFIADMLSAKTQLHGLNDNTQVKQVSKRNKVSSGDTPVLRIFGTDADGVQTLLLDTSKITP